jgi:hypothetical protein
VVPLDNCRNTGFSGRFPPGPPQQQKLARLFLRIFSTNPSHLNLFSLFARIIKGIALKAGPDKVVCFYAGAQFFENSLGESDEKINYVSFIYSAGRYRLGSLHGFDGEFGQ